MLAEKDILRIEEPVLEPAETAYLPAILKGLAMTFTHLFKKKVTIQYPEQKRPLAPNARGIHRLNRDEQGRVKCVACFMCSTACPAHCIHIVGAESPWPDREKYPASFVIDELRCIYCGMCEEACPVDAIELTTSFELSSFTREEMLFDKEKLLSIYDKTKDSEKDHIGGVMPDHMLMRKERSANLGLVEEEKDDRDVLSFCTLKVAPRPESPDLIKKKS
jgi:NADH-quinone oxidoreductase subunit I